MARHQKVESIFTDGINVKPNPLRSLDGEEVKRLAVSMQRIGLMTPITVRYHENIPSSDGLSDDSYELIAGRHRLAAAISLGWEKIDAIEIECSDVDAKLWEIAENLHRTNFTQLQRKEQIALWVKLTDENLQSAELRPIEESKRKDGRGHRKEGGINAAARELGVKRTTAQEAIRVASLSPEAKAAAVEHGLDNNRSALLEAAKESCPKAQVAKIVERAGKKVTPKAKPAPNPIESDDPIELPDEDDLWYKPENLQERIRIDAALSVNFASSLNDQKIELLITKTCNGNAKVVAAAARHAEAIWGALAARIEKAAGLKGEDVARGRIALKAKADRAEARSRAVAT